MLDLRRQGRGGDPALLGSVAVIMLVARIVVWSLLILVALENFGVNITALLAGLGVGGVAIALALQNILGDLFASLSIALDKPFIVGDSLTIDSFSGSVEKIGIKTTRLRSDSGEQIILSNADILKAGCATTAAPRSCACCASCGCATTRRPRACARSRRCCRRSSRRSRTPASSAATSRREISFACGRVSKFSNFAVMSKGQPLPVEFHASLNDECNATPNRAAVP